MNAARRWLLLANGAFLVVVGGVQVVFELLAYYAGIGPYGYLFEDSPYAIGWVEAHGLAFIIGVLLLAVAARPGRVAAHTARHWSRTSARLWRLVSGRRPSGPQTHSVQNC